MTHRPLVSFAIAENQITIRKVRRPSLTIPNSRIRANSGASMSPRWRRPCIWYAFGHDVYDPLKKSWKTALEWSDLSGKQKHRTSSMKTSVLCTKEVRCFTTSGPQPLSLLYKKSFWKSPTPTSTLSGGYYSACQSVAFWKISRGYYGFFSGGGLEGWMW